MEKKIVISKRFRNDALRVHQYLLKKFSANTADSFLNHLEKRINFIAANPETGKLSEKRKNVRSILFTSYNQIFYRYQDVMIEILCLFDMRKDPKKRPY